MLGVWFGFYDFGSDVARVVVDFCLIALDAVGWYDITSCILVLGFGLVFAGLL